ncbi:hypothetical protein Tco_1114149 [Tanacetum coccineum]|uniref:Uncharacterized protein n=1 Tax=Tanacetum coccineum TaxID=301880 RepID=A0ABQ5IUP9_9ASTR
MVLPQSRPGVTRVCVEVDLLKKKPNLIGSGPAIEETSNHSRHEAPEKAWRTSFVESSIGPNAYHMGDRPVRQRTMLDFSINFLISRLTDIYLIEPQRTERANVVKAKAEKPRAAPAREIKVERADISTAFGCSAFARIAAFLTGNGPLKSNPRSFDSVHLVARPSFALTLRCLLWPIGEPLKAALLKKGDTSCHLAEPTSLLAANRTTKKMRRNHRSLSFKPLRRIGRMKASKKQLTLRRIPLCDSDEEGGSGASSSSPVMIATVSGHFGESSCRMRNRRDWWVGDAPLDQSRHEQRVNHRYEGTCGSLRVDPREPGISFAFELHGVFSYDGERGVSSRSEIGETIGTRFFSARNSTIDSLVEDLFNAESNYGLTPTWLDEASLDESHLSPYMCEVMAEEKNEAPADGSWRKLMHGILRKLADV